MQGCLSAAGRDGRRPGRPSSHGRLTDRAKDKITLIQAVADLKKGPITGVIRTALREKEGLPLSCSAALRRLTAAASLLLMAYARARSRFTCGASTMI
jgi:hypothetical protein